MIYDISQPLFECEVFPGDPVPQKTVLRHAARMLDKASEAALRLGYRGIWTVGQDNNLASLGGLDTEVYNGTKLEGNADIHFYKEF